MDETNKRESGSGSLVGSIIVVIILIVGAIYLFSQKTTAPTAPENGAPINLSDEVSNDSLDAIEADANAASLNTLDQDLNQLDQTLGS